MTTQDTIREHPIVFSKEMVKAVIAGRKTMTRSVITPQPPEDWSPDWVGYYCPTIEKPNGELSDGPEIFGACNEDCGIKCPFGGPGDRLWFRESFYIDDVRWADGERLPKDRPDDLSDDQIFYRADSDCFKKKPKWRSARSMPRWAAQTILEITGIRVERLHSITRDDIAAEGCSFFSDWIYLWDSLNLKHGFGWQFDPWVWVVEFRRIA